MEKKKKSPPPRNEIPDLEEKWNSRIAKGWEQGITKLSRISDSGNTYTGACLGDWNIFGAGVQQQALTPSKPFTTESPV